LETRYCLWMLSLTIACSLLQMHGVFLRGRLEYLPIVILNIFSLTSITVLGYWLTKSAVKEKVLKDAAIQERDRALAEKEQYWKLVEEKSKEVEAYGKRLSEANRELMLQQSQLLNLTEDLEKANLELQKVSLMKSEFVSVVSHELRTPLTVIKESVSLIQEESFSTISFEQRKFLSMIRVNVERLSHLIQDILDFSKLESGKMKIKQEKVEAKALVHLICEALLEQSKKAGVELLASSDSGPAIFTYADMGRLRQVIDNLVTNALKFTPFGGKIEVKVELMSREQVLSEIKNSSSSEDLFKPQEFQGFSVWKNFVVFSVKDTGTGISRPDIQKIFDKFYQVDVNDTRPRGTGLGLAIVKQLVLAQQGGLWVESQPEKGSCFKICLPVYEEAMRLKNSLNEWVSAAVSQQQNGVLTMLDFKAVNGAGRNWLECVRNVDNIENEIAVLSQKNDRGILRIGGSQVLVVSLNSSHNQVLDLVEQIKAMLAGHTQERYPVSLNFDMEFFSPSDLNVDKFLEKIEKMAKKVSS
jgi:signal transduction histidine kinase/GGDEF domain-containing protein